MRQTGIPCVIQRGGTSKGAYFLTSDLPSDAALRDRVLLAVMGSPDPRQIDGLGGADPLTSKVAIVGKSAEEDVDLDYLFCQVKVDRPAVDVTPNCGNMLAGVAPFALERGLVPAEDGTTAVRIRMVNSGNLCDVRVLTPGGSVSYEGSARIDGVPGTASPVMIDFLDTAGSACGALLPTGNAIDNVDGVEVTCIDNGMPVVLLRASDLDVTGHETRDELNAANGLRKRLESIRLQLGETMKLGDVTEKVVPKMCLVARPAAGGAIAARCFIPHVCHASIGVLAAVTVGTACVIAGSIAHGIAELPDDNPVLIPVEHPSGQLSVELETNGDGAPRRAALLRTARRLMEGNVFVPASVWDGKGTAAEVAP